MISRTAWAAPRSRISRPKTAHRWGWWRRRATVTTSRMRAGTSASPGITARSRPIGRSFPGPAPASSSCEIDPTSPAGLVLPSAIPNHAHTDSSPAFVPGEQGYTILWKGDHENGGSGTEKILWSMSYGVDGWQAAVQVPGARPNGSPSAFLGVPPVYESWLTTYAAWADSSGQIWWSQWNGSTGLPGPSTP